MKNRTIYEVLDKVMQDYLYSIQKTGNKVEIKGSVFIPRIDIEVTHEKVFYYSPEDKSLIIDDGNAKLAKAIVTFKEELKEKVVSVIKEHKEELTDDEAMIDKLRYEIKNLKKALSETEDELKEAREKITRLELERISTQPLPYTPWTNPNPWSTGITWETHIGDQPDWMDKNTITCDNPDDIQFRSDVTCPDGIKMNNGSVYFTSEEDFLANKCKYHKSNNKKRNGGER